MIYKITHKSIFLLILGIAYSTISQTPVNAQIVVDPITNTKKLIEGQKTTISGGIEKNQFLLHNFTEFNIPKNSSVFFLNPNSKDTIITRIVGSSISNILGNIETQGKTNFVLINSNGINFFKESSLSINGSFLASTADMTNIIDDKLFIDYLNNDSTIFVEGEGHNLIFSGNSRIPNFFNKPQSLGLSISPNNSLSLLAGRIDFDAGILSSPSGVINMVAVENGSAIIRNTSEGLSIESSLAQRGDIQLRNRSFINASGEKFGSIYVKANKLNISDASLIRSENLGTDQLGKIDVNVSELVIDGITDKTPLFPFTFDTYARGISSVSNQGKGPEIKITADTLTLLNQGLITSYSESSSDGGDINIKVKSDINLEGKTPFNPFLPFGSFIGTVTRGSGKAGNINLEAQDLIINDGANIQSVVLNTGDGGDIDINIRNKTSLSGFSPISNIPSIISTISVGNLNRKNSGTGGKLKIKSTDLLLEGGGRIDSSTLSDGNSGSVDVEANTIVIKGRIPNDESSQIKWLHRIICIFRTYLTMGSNREIY